MLFNGQVTEEKMFSDRLIIYVLVVCLGVCLSVFCTGKLVNLRVRFKWYKIFFDYTTDVN